MKCTWVDCESDKAAPQKALDGEVWARLCPEHRAALDAAVVRSGASLFSAWVKAQGGSEVASMRCCSAR
jgi:predicted HicB family RNase H-like nuclease